MIISIYSSKGSAGKTPIATNIILDKNYLVGTNEKFHIYDELVKDDELIAIDITDEFPIEIKNRNLDIVFDLAGTISSQAHSITSAIKMSDIVIVPIYNELKSLKSGINSIDQILNHNKNVIVVATKLIKQKGEIFNDWHKSADYKNIANLVHNEISKDIPILPLKFSKVFDNIFEEELSINQIMDKNSLARYSYKDVAKQFNEIYKVINI